MGMPTSTRHLAAWLAFCAILFAALAPSVSHALASARGELMVEICSPAGSRFVDVNAAQTDAPAAAAHFEHCPFCSTQGDMPAALPSTGFSIPLADSMPRLPRLFFQSPRPLSIWSPAQSRAPPVQT
jgi:hypothetical protein